MAGVSWKKLFSNEHELREKNLLAKVVTLHAFVNGLHLFDIMAIG